LAFNLLSLIVGPIEEEDREGNLRFFPIYQDFGLLDLDLSRTAGVESFWLYTKSVYFILLSLIMTKRKTNKSVVGRSREEEDQTEADSKPKNEDAKKSKAVWSASEDDALLKAVLEDQQDREDDGDGDEEEDWDEIANSVQGKTPVQCLKRYLALNKRQASASTELASPSALSPAPAPAPPKDEDGGEEAEAEEEEEDEEEDDEDDEDEDEDEEETPISKKSKRAKKDSDSSAKWNADEIELLKKLVEQYKDSE
jgi:hypothetical protein